MLERRSRRRGSVGFEGSEMLRDWKRERRSEVAVGEEMLGRVWLRAVSRVGMKAIRWKGSSKLMVVGGR